VLGLELESKLIRVALQSLERQRLVFLVLIDPALLLADHMSQLDVLGFAITDLLLERSDLLLSGLELRRKNGDVLLAKKKIALERLEIGLLRRAPRNNRVTERLRESERGIRSRGRRGRAVLRLEEIRHFALELFGFVRVFGCSRRGSVVFAEGLCGRNF